MMESVRIMLAKERASRVAVLAELQVRAVGVL